MASASVAVGVDDAVLGAGVELADGGLGEGHLGVVGLGVGGEDGDGEGADVGGDVGGGAGLMVAASGEGGGEEQGEGAEAHRLFSIVARRVFVREKFGVGKLCFYWGF